MNFERTLKQAKTCIIKSNLKEIGNMKRNRKKQSFSLFILLLTTVFTSCATQTPSLSQNKKYEDIITTKEEQVFFQQNKIPKERTGFYELFFSYIEADTLSFFQNTERFLEQNASHHEAEALKLWVAIKYANMFRRDTLSFEKIKDFYIKHIQNDFIKLLMKRVEQLYAQHMKVKEENLGLHSLNKWYVTGPYRMSGSISLEKLRFDKPSKKLFVKDKSVYFKEGGLVVPSYQAESGRVYQFETLFKNDQEHFKLYFLNAKTKLIVKLNDEIIFNNDNPYKMKDLDVVKIRLPKGVHKLNITLYYPNKELYVYSDAKLQLQEKKEKLTLSQVKPHYESLLDKTIATFLESKDAYSFSFKSLIIADLLIDLSNSYDEFYQYIHLAKKNFYVDYLFYTYYSGMPYAGKSVRDKYAQEYLRKSIKKNDKFLASQLDYILLKNGSKPYQAMGKLEALKAKGLWYDNILLGFYLKNNLINKYVQLVKKMQQKENGSFFLLKYQVKNLKKYIYPLYLDIYQQFKEKLIYKVDLLKPEDIAYIFKQSQRKPYSQASLSQLVSIREFLDKKTQKLAYKPFKSMAQLYQLKHDNKPIKETVFKLKDSFKGANLFLNTWEKYIQYEDTKSIIKRFKKAPKKDDFPTRCLLDYDIIFAEKDYYVTVSRKIIKINNQNGLRAYSNLSKKNNYLKISTISNDTLEEYHPDYHNTSEISLKKLKVGDYIETIEYTINRTNYIGFSIVSLFRKTNQGLEHGKVDLYLSDDLKHLDRKVYVTYKSGITSNQVKKKKVENYTVYQYENKNIEGIKPEPFTLRDLTTFLPRIYLKSTLTWKEIYEEFQKTYEYLRKSSHITEMLKEFKLEKKLTSIKALYYQLIKDYKHTHNTSLFFDTTYLNKSGNLAYFMKMILDEHQIKSNVLLVHNKLNLIHDGKEPSTYTYTDYLLRVEFDGVFYYLDFSNKWNKFNELSPYYRNQYYLRLDDEQHVFKEQLKSSQSIKTETKIDVDIQEDLSANVSIAFHIPAHMAGLLKGTLVRISEDKLNMIFRGLVSRLFGLIEGFKLEFIGVKEQEVPLKINIQFQKKYFVRKEGKSLILSHFLKHEVSKGIYSRVFMEDYSILPERQLPLLLSYYFNDQLLLNIHFPKGYEAQNIQEINEKNQVMHYTIKGKIKENQIQLTRDYFIDIAILVSSKYQDFKQRAEKIKAIKSQDITAIKK